MRNINATVESQAVGDPDSYRCLLGISTGMVICAVWVVEGRVVSPMVHIGMYGDDCYKYAQHFSLTASFVPNMRIQRLAFAC